MQIFNARSMKLHPRTVQGTKWGVVKALCHFSPESSLTVPQGIVYHASFFCLCSNTDLMTMAVLNFNNIDYERVTVWDHGIKILGTPATSYLFLPLMENAILSFCSRDQSPLLSPSNGSKYQLYLASEIRVVRSRCVCD